MSEERAVVTLVRRKRRDDAPTIGDIEYDDLKIVVLERPRAPAPKDYAHDGKPHPCIPASDIGYDVNWTENIHPKHPFSYQVITGFGTPAPDRSDVLFHSANWIRQLLGCLAPGLHAEVVEGSYDGVAIKEYGVSGSSAALGLLLDKLCRKDFRLIIKEA